MLRLARILLRIAVGLLAVALLALAGLIFTMRWLHSRPVTLPAPAGPYAVGRVEYDWVDASRAETFGLGKDGHRELDVWVWYPAAAAPGSAGAPPAPYLPPAWRAARAQSQQPAFLAQFLIQEPAVVTAHAVAGLPLAPAQVTYPVVIFQPGLGPILPDYTTLAEDLASRGYVVVGSTPTYSSAVAVFPDGRVAVGTPAANVSDLATPAEAQQVLDRLIQVWAADDRFVLDQAEQLNRSDPDGRFTGHLDLGAVGFYGHSFGGADAAEACHLDSRCRAGVDLDGSPYGDVVQAGLDRPFMTLWSDSASAGDLRTVAAMESRLGGDGYQMQIHGGQHFNFTDNGVFYSPFLRLRGGLGPIDGRRFLNITTTYVGAFFDHYLKGQAAPLLGGPSTQYPEVTFIAR
jgi:predicted dienelactone hydrolase